jgi:uncharacterized membrane protein
MPVMIAGLLVFLGMHSLRVFAPQWREVQVRRLGEGAWKGVYSLVSVVGLGVAIWGFGLQRADPVFLWFPPTWLSHVTALLMIPSFVLLVATYVPANHIRAAVGHPMVLAVKTWAFAHLLVNGRLGDIIFFGAFLLWAVVLFRTLRRARTDPPAPGTVRGTAITVALGIAAYVAFAIHLHVWVTGVPVFR